jgi:hypothetical protein
MPAQLGRDVSFTAIRLCLECLPLHPETALICRLSLEALAIVLVAVEKRQRIYVIASSLWETTERRMSALFGTKRGG